MRWGTAARCTELHSIRSAFCSEQSELVRRYAFVFQILLDLTGGNKDRLNLVVEPDQIFPSQIFDESVTGDDSGQARNGVAERRLDGKLQEPRDEKPGQAGRAGTGQMQTPNVFRKAEIEHFQDRGVNQLVTRQVAEFIDADGSEAVHSRAVCGIAGKDGAVRQGLRF